MTSQQRTSQVIRIRLTNAQTSALECAGLEHSDDLVDEESLRDDLAILSSSWNRDKRTLTVTDETRESLWRALNDRSNAEDAAAEEDDDAEMRTFARRASRSLASLGSRVLCG